MAAEHCDLTAVRVLVIDDDPDSRDALRLMLEHQHAMVRTGNSVREALSALAVAPFDVIVSDIGMPYQDGYDLVRQLRALPGRVGLTPAIAVTAFTRADDQTRALRAGFQRHLHKPIDAAELVDAVAAVAGRLHDRTSVHPSNA